MNATVLVVKTTQTAIPELKREEKNLYFLKIEINGGETTLNVGEKTYNTIKKLQEKTIEPPPEKLTNLGQIKPTK